ncbi:MAG: hypothetical protein ACJ72W_27420 [Actinoallomurus sp.]
MMFGVSASRTRQGGADIVVSTVAEALPEGQAAFAQLVTAVTRVIEASATCEEEPDSAAAQSSISRVGSPSQATSGTSSGQRPRRSRTTAGPAPSSRRHSLPTPMTIMSGRPSGRGSAPRTRCTGRSCGWPVRMPR